MLACHDGKLVVFKKFDPSMSYKRDIGTLFSHEPHDHLLNPNNHCVPITAFPCVLDEEDLLIMVMLFLHSMERQFYLTDHFAADVE
jgi:hypothetical protein